MTYNMHSIIFKRSDTSHNNLKHNQARRYFTHKAYWMHKFHKSPAKLAKLQENNENKIVIEIKILWGTIFVVIFFTKEYIPLIFHLDHNLEDNDDVFLILKINRGPHMAYS